MSYSSSSASKLSISLQKIILSPCNDKSIYASSELVSQKIFTVCQYGKKYEINTLDWKNGKKSSILQEGKFLTFLDDTYLVDVNGEFTLYNAISEKIIKRFNYRNDSGQRLEYNTIYHQKMWKLIQFYDTKRPQDVSYLVFNPKTEKYFYHKLNGCIYSNCDLSLLIDDNEDPWISANYHNIDSGAVTVRMNEGFLLSNIVKNKTFFDERNDT